MDFYLSFSPKIGELLEYGGMHHILASVACACRREAGRLLVKAQDNGRARAYETAASVVQSIIAKMPEGV